MRGITPSTWIPLTVHELTIGEPVLNEPQHERARVAMGQARRWADRLDLARVTPQANWPRPATALLIEGAST